MRRWVSIAGLALLTSLVLPLAVASAQVDDPDTDGLEGVEDAEADDGEPLAPPAQLRIEAADVSSYPEVNLTVSVTAHPDGPLPASAFAVSEQGESRSSMAAYSESEDLQVMLLIDTTGSMGGPPMAGAQSAATTFVEVLPDEVQLAILGYDVEATVVTDFSASRDDHLGGIQGLVADGSTAMYDAVQTAVDTFPETDDVSRVIVLLTDGEDNASTATVEEAVDALVDADVTLHSVEYLTAYHEGVGIRSMANATGGAVLRADDAAALTAIYEQLAVDLTSRYEVTYTSDAHGRTDVRVEVDHDGLVASGTRAITMPAAPAEPDEDAEEAIATPPVVTEPPTIPPAEASVGRAALIGGAVLWFVALAIFIALFIAPRERRAQLAGLTARKNRGATGMTEWANRATLLAERGLERRGYRGGLNVALERAGINLRPGEFVVLAGCVAFTAGVVGRLLHGWLMAMVLALFTIIASRLFVSIRAQRRQARFADQLGETLQLLSGSLRAGYSLMQAVDSVAREADSPSAEEFSRLVVETRLGRDMSEALRAMADRMQSDDFSWVMQAIEIHREVGGDLAEVLDNVAETIRERNQIRRQVQALSAEGKLSAYVLIALPFGVGGFILLTNPSYLAELTNGGLLGWGMLGMGAILMTLGIVWMRNLVKFRF